MKSRVIFRADGNSQVGLGHVVRSLALAQMLQPEFDCLFAIRQPSPELKKQIEEICPVLQLSVEEDLYNEAAKLSSEVLSASDIVVPDGYHFDTRYQRLLRQSGCKLVCIDDLHNQHFVADLIINHGGGITAEAYSAEPYTRFLLGPEYALLRPPFLESIGRQRSISEVTTAFVNMGGADAHNITQTVVQALQQVAAITEVHVVVGSAYPYFQELQQAADSWPGAQSVQLHRNIGAEQLCEILQACQFAVCPASSVSLEIFSVGLNLLTGFTAANQQHFAGNIHAQGLGVSCGNFLELGLLELSRLIVENLENNTWQHQKKAVGGKQKEVFRAEFKKLQVQ